MHTSPKEAKSISNSSDRKRDSARLNHPKPPDLPFPVPSDILQDIEPVSYLNVYSNVYTQRDRRLRRLIRRYVNQIQYGCTNIGCDAPTCLSYRRRNSRIPLRRYNDLSARTLACQLIEEYGKQGTNPIAGLCSNPPIVPWYEDPNDVKKRQRSERNRLKEDVNEAKPDRGHEFEKPQPINEIRRSESANEVLLGLPSSAALTKGYALDEVEEHTNSSTAAQHTSDQGVLEPSVNPVGTEICQSDQPGKAKKKDQTSLTQCLFDLLSLRFLTSRLISDTQTETDLTEKTVQRPSTSPLFPTDQQEEEDLEFPTSNESTNNQDDLDPNSLDKYKNHFFTLNRLSWNSLTWLGSAKSLPNPESESSFDRFVQQSIWYCLSNPNRLINSANDWRAVEEPEFEVYRDEMQKRSSLKEAKIDNAQNTSSNNTKLKFNLLEQMTAFVKISRTRPYEEMLDALFSSMQQSFVLPPWFDKCSNGKRFRGPEYLRIVKQQSNQNNDKFKHSQYSDDHYPNDSAFLQNNTVSGLHVHERSHYLKDNQVSQLCFLALLASVSLVFEYYDPLPGPVELSTLANIRNTGHAYPNLSLAPKKDSPEHWSRFQSSSSMISTIDLLEDWHVIRLTASVMECISHRIALAEARKASKMLKDSRQPLKNMVEMLIEVFNSDSYIDSQLSQSMIPQLVAMIIELIRTVMLKLWDRSPVIQASSAVGGALRLLSGFFLRHKELGLTADQFYMPFVADAFEDTEMPIEWLTFRPDNLRIHLLSFSFLFEPATLVKYFRTVNMDIMRKSYETAAVTDKYVRECLLAGSIPIYGKKEALAHLRPHMVVYFVLTIRRTDVLNDAINQIWRRQRRELMQPLRVRLGKDEGEDGLDHGGVQQEFFRIVFAEAFQPDYGMFTVDQRTRMTWFQPGSLEPLYKFEAMGILMSLAVYNAVTLPITFPLAFYRKLLKLKVKKLEHIADGWPELTSGLAILLNWTDGDVGDVIARTYEFSCETLGTVLNVDMQKFGREDTWPPVERPSRKGKEKAKTTSFELPLGPQYTPPIQPSPLLIPAAVPSLSRTSSVEIKGVSTPISMESDINDEPALVTNNNREQYVKDYIFWLTDKSIRPQYDAFAKGFYTCLDQTALSLFTPEALRDVMEGHRDIDIDELERTATYDEYEKISPTIVTFWEIVRSFNSTQHRQLLEFVTASDRIPVNGISSIQFMIQRNGDDDNRLPSSSTCYGRLLLPQYSTRAVMEEKLTKAIENSLGFGAL